MTISKDINIYEKASKEDVLKKLVEIFGKANVSQNQADLYPYSYDMTESPPHMPDFVVIPENKEQLIVLVKYCNQNIIPIVPYISGNNVGGLTIPERGGIIVDFGKKMNRILHVNEDLMYAILEPGVTFGQFKAYLDKNHPNLRYSYPFAPPYASAVGNVMLSGMNNLSNKIGSMADSINGLEVITAEGDVARLGSCFYGKEEADPDSWWCRYPMPDLVGIFLNWQGMTGLVTKCAVQLWPKDPYQNVLLSVIFNQEDVGPVIRQMGRTEIVNDNMYATLEVIKMVVGFPEPKRIPGEPFWFTISSLSGKTKNHLMVKEEIYYDTVKKLQDQGVSIHVIGTMDDFAKIFDLRARCAVDLPAAVLLLYEYSGLTWFGSYAPSHKLEILSAKVTEIFKKYDVPNFIYGKPMKGSHFCLFRPIMRYKKYKEGEEEKYFNLLKEIAEFCIKEGCIPYKTPIWMTEIMKKYINPGWLKLFDKVKNMMDPNGIFNPGRWGT